MKLKPAIHAVISRPAIKKLFAAIGKLAEIEAQSQHERNTRR
jgi:hypothetical protein